MDPVIAAIAFIGFGLIMLGLAWIGRPTDTVLEGLVTPPGRIPRALGVQETDVPRFRVASMPVRGGAFAPASALVPSALGA